MKSRPAHRSSVDRQIFKYICDVKIKRNVSLFFVYSLAFFFGLFSFYFVSLVVVAEKPLGVVKSKCIRVIWCKVYTQFSYIQSCYIYFNVIPTLPLLGYSHSLAVKKE